MSNQENTKVAGVADFVICLDITASMTDCIENLKTSLKAFVDSLTEPLEVEKQNITFKITEWQGRLLPYRDLDEDPDGKQIYEDFPFVDNAEALRAQVDDPRVVANGGGGLEESSLDAFYRAAVNSSWPENRKSNKFIILFSDAPAKSELSKKTVASGPRDVGEVVQQLRGKHIIPVILATTCPAFEAVLEVAKERGVHEASQLFSSPTEAEAFFNSNAKFDKMMELLGKSLSKSASEEL